MKALKIIAHRGASGYAPENTLIAFRKALQMGADMVEFDVHALPSGEIVLMHDNRVNRTTNGKGYVLQHGFAELRSLDAGAGEIVPTLEEVLDLIDRQIPVNIELKGPGTAQGVARIVKQYLSHGWQSSDFLISSFNHHELAAFKRLVPEIEVAALDGNLPLGYAAFAEELQAVAVCLSHEFVTKEYILDAHKRGMEVYVWTVDDPEEVERVCIMGADGIFTNVPDIARVTSQSLALSSQR
jgi:glycerophosphoryl diester phosphodiesterase